MVVERWDEGHRRETIAANRRLFLALSPGDEVRAALTRARDRWTWAAAARPTPVANLHVTLVFLGAVPACDVAPLVAALPLMFEPFELRLGNHSSWDNGIAALEPVDECPPLMALQAAVAKRTAALGFTTEARRYRPHVTLARDARGSVGPIDGQVIAWRIAEYALIESRGGRYSTIAVWRL